MHFWLGKVERAFDCRICCFFFLSLSLPRDLVFLLLLMDVSFLVVFAQICSITRSCLTFPPGHRLFLRRVNWIQG